MSSLTLLWILFWLIFCAVSVLDFVAIGHRHGAVGARVALQWTGLWVAVAFGFSLLVYFLHPRGPEIATLFVAGYLTEYSLSIDNLFVFILIFSLMGVPEGAQPKLIKLGIYLSIFLRVLFILFGIAIVHRFHWLLYVFGVLLIWTAWKMLTSDENEQVHPEKNLLYRAASRFLPVHAGDPASDRLFTRFQGRRCITPFFLVFLVIGSTDVLFAVDSIPAIMGISQDPFVVLTSNIFAVLGLNSLFFAVRGIMTLFKFLKHGVSLILFFVGAKMIAGLSPAVDTWFKAHTYVSLLVIGGVLLGSVALSLWHSRISDVRSPPAGL